MLLNIEAQSHRNPGYDISARAEFYASTVFGSQKGRVFAKSDYDGLENVYSVWIILNSLKERRSTVITGYRDWVLHGPDGSVKLGWKSRTNIIILNLGIRGGGGPPDAMELLSILLLGSGDPGDKRERIRAKFNIDLSDNYLKDVDDVNEFENVLRDLNSCGVAAQKRSAMSGIPEVRS